MLPVLRAHREMIVNTTQKQAMKTTEHTWPIIQHWTSYTQLKQYLGQLEQYVEHTREETNICVKFIIRIQISPLEKLF